MASDVEKLLLLLSYARRHPGAPVAEVAEAVGLPADELRRSLVPLLSLVGRPPFSPADLIEIWIDGRDRLHVELDQSLGRPLRLTREEGMALKAALSSLAGSGAGPYAETARAVIERLGQLWDAASPEQLVVEGGAPDPAGIAARFGVLERGVAERRAVEIVYYTASRDELTERRLQPYALLQILGAWYVVGHDDKRGEERLFKVERVREARLTDERFTPPADFDAARYLDRARSGGPRQGRAEVRFSPPLARLIVEENPPERVTRLEGGGAILLQEFDELEWLAGWALAFGDGAEVLSPPEARAAIAARCRETLAQYR
jgi:proteasome accessory factor C